MTTTDDKKPTKKAKDASRKFNKRHVGYRNGVDEEFYQLAEQGKSLTEIAYILRRPKDILMNWAESTEYRSFGRAYKAGREACQAFHERLLDDMVTGKIDKVSAKQIDAQTFRLKTLFHEDWAPVEKKEVSVTNKESQLTDDELEDRLKHLLNTDSTRKAIEALVKRDFKPDVKLVKDNKDE